MGKSDRIINNIVKILEGMTVGTGGFTSSATDSGPVAGFDPMMKFRNKNNKVDFRRIPISSRKIYDRWLNFK
jgi:hypothetical protein